MSSESPLEACVNIDFLCRNACPQLIFVVQKVLAIDEDVQIIHELIVGTEVEIEDVSKVNVGLISLQLIVC